MLLLEGMMGLGDNLYQRAVLKAFTASSVILKTPWPQFYVDIPHVYTQPRNSRLRTQAKNERRRNLPWRLHAPVFAQFKRWHYAADNLSIVESLALSLGMRLPADMLLDMTGPPLPSKRIVDGAYVVVRPVTRRREWESMSRNPLPQYVNTAAGIARDNGYKVVSIADLQPNEEWIEGSPPPADIRFHNGELTVEDMFCLLAGAVGCIGGVGFIAPAALAYRVPLLLVFGGWGFSNNPDRIFGPHVDSSIIEKVLPDNFCQCSSNRHQCDKRISRIEQRIETWLLSLNGRESSSMAA